MSRTPDEHIRPEEMEQLFFGVSISGEQQEHLNLVGSVHKCWNGTKWPMNIAGDSGRGAVGDERMPGPDLMVAPCRGRDRTRHGPTVATRCHL